MSKTRSMWLTRPVANKKRTSGSRTTSDSDSDNAFPGVTLPATTFKVSSKSTSSSSSGSTGSVSDCPSARDSLVFSISTDLGHGSTEDQDDITSDHGGWHDAPQADGVFWKTKVDGLKFRVRRLVSSGGRHHSHPRLHQLRQRKPNAPKLKRRSSTMVFLAKIKDLFNKSEVCYYSASRMCVRC